MGAERARLTRGESQAQTRERLLGAARAEVARQGFGAASVRTIAEAAGYSQGALYSNFASKEALLLELLREHMRDEAAQLAQLLEPTPEAPGDALARLRSWAETLNVEVDWSLLALELQLHAHRSPAFARAYDEVFLAHSAALGTVVERFFNALGRRPRLDSRQLAAGLMALAHGLALQRRTDAEAPAGRLIVTFVEGLLATAGPA